MIVDLVGPNCVGKSTVVQHLAALRPIRFVELAGTRFATPPGMSALPRMLLTASPGLRRFMLRCLRQGRPDLAVRAAHFSEWNRQHHPPDALNIREEGLLKKLLEAVPWVSGRKVLAAANFWLSLVEDSADWLISETLASASLVIVAELPTDEYLRRIRARQFFSYRDEQVLGRYEIQQRCAALLYERAKARGAPVHRVSFEDTAPAATSIAGLIDRRRREVAAA